MKDPLLHPFLLHELGRLGDLVSGCSKGYVTKQTWRDAVGDIPRIPAGVRVVLPLPAVPPHEHIADDEIRVFPAHDLPEVRFRQCDLDITGQTQDERDHWSDVEQHKGDFDEGGGADGDDSGVIEVLNELDADSDVDTDADTDDNGGTVELVDALLLRQPDVSILGLTGSDDLTITSGADRGRHLLRGHCSLYTVVRLAVCPDAVRKGWFCVALPLASGTRVTPWSGHAQR